MGRTDGCSKMPVSNKFATMKVRGDFLAWLRRESVRRGTFHYETLEDFVARGMGGKRPWQGVSR